MGQMMEAIYMMWLRQLKRYWRSKARMIGTLGQPTLFLVAFGFGFSAVFEKAGGGDYLQFLTPGIIAMSILFTAMFTGIEIIWDRKFGFLKETMVAPVSRIRIMLGKTLGGATVAMAQGIVVLIISLIIGFRPSSITYIPVAILFMFIIAFMFTSLGIAIASRLEDMQAFPLIINFLIMPIFFLSGALFPLEGIPFALTIVTRIDPMTYGVDGLRSALTGMNHFSMALDAGIIIAVTAAIFFMGSLLFTKIEI